MLCPLETLDHNELKRIVDEQYGAGGGSVEFMPLGEDSWSYRLGNLWISIRRDLRGHVPAAYEASAAMQRFGVDFVLGPLAGADGQVVRRIDGHPVVVFPYLPVVPLSDPSPQEAERVVEMLSQVHQMSVDAPLPTENYELPFSDDLDLALSLPEASPPEGGPYGARLHGLLGRHQSYISSLRSEYEELAVTAAQTLPVLTHGEPLATNILRHGDDLLIADWGDASWGPPERDWTHVRRTIGGNPPCRPDILRLYDIRWILSEIAEYTERFHAPHSGDGDDDAMWNRLVQYLPEV